MEENKQDQVEVKKKSEVKKERRSIKTMLGIYRGEFDKITWPSRPELIKQTFTVIVTSLMVAAVIACMDYVFLFAYQTLLNVVG